MGHVGLPHQGGPPARSKRSWGGQPVHAELTCNRGWATRSKGTDVNPVTVRSRFRHLLALCVLAASVLTLLLGHAGPADAAKSPAPAPIVEISLPNLVTQPSTAPSRPVKLEVPGLAKVEVGLPDVGTLLGGNKAASAAPEPTRTGGSNTPTATPSSPRPAAAPTSAPAAVSSGSAGAAPRPTPSRAAATRQASRTVVPVAAEVPVRNDSQTSKTKQPAAPKARAAAEVFRGMLKGNLPVWLLVGIVVACAAGTAMVVRSGRRQDAS